MDRPLEKKKWPLNKKLTYLFIVLLTSLFAYGLFFRSNQTRMNVKFEQLMIDTVEEGSFQEFIPVDGMVEPLQTFYLDAKLGGTVEKIYVDDGDLLEKGDTILKLSNVLLELEYMNYESKIFDLINNLQHTKLSFEQNNFKQELDITGINYELEKAALEFNRKELLFEQKLISNEEFENAKREYEYLKKELTIKKDLKEVDSISRIQQLAYINSSVKRMKNNLHVLNEMLNNLYVTSPVKGQLSSFDSETGETKIIGQKLGQVDVIEAFVISADIDERYITRIFVGQEADFDYSGNIYHIQISKIYSQVKNGVFKVNFSFVDEPPANIKKGQTLQLRLKFSGTSDAIVLKRGAFFQETGGNWIYFVTRDGNAAIKRDIKIGRQNTFYYEVLEGLKPGDMVIISSYENFGNKDKLILR